MRHLRMAAIALGLPAALGLPGAPTAALASGHEAVPLFQSASRCLVCHNGLKSVAGHDASIGAQWRSSVMANSARDPYWRAGVSREIVDHPEARDHIQQECSACHLPIAHAQATLANRRSLPFDLLAPPAGHADVQLAMEGVNCSVCHQIQDSGLGEPATFNGEFRIAPPDPHGVRPEYGPYVIDAGRQLIMRSSSGGFEPRHGAHVADSKLCASCHTLFTAPLGESTPVGAEFPEQMPWFEWLHSRYREERSCQSCHMPAAPDDAPVSAVLGTPRPAPAGHSFSGANVFMQRLFAAHREALGISVPGAELEAAADGTERFLKEQAAASVSIERTSLQQGRLVAELRVTNLEATAADRLSVASRVAARLPHRCRGREGVRVRRTEPGRLDHGQRQRRRPHALRAALRANSLSRPGADLRGYPGHAAGEGDHRVARRFALPEGQPGSCRKASTQGQRGSHHRRRR
ncbi:MAG: hypothetical protein U1F35_19470 [Steroidobacteraceae bacterium]